jgi:hypothetical protein
MLFLPNGSSHMQVGLHLLENSKEGNKLAIAELCVWAREAPIYL